MSMPDLTLDKLYPIGWSLVYKPVCAPASWDKERIEREANLLEPTGIESTWKMADGAEKVESWSQGKGNGFQCPDCPTRKHWLLWC